jgi:hypothetical protein
MKTRKVFETATVDLKVRGQHYFQHPVEDVSPAEYLLLQDLHGVHSVKFVKKQKDGALLHRSREDGKWEKRPLTTLELRDKLVGKYGQKRYESVFPNKMQGLPWTFDDIGVDEKRNGFLSEEPIEEPDADFWEEAEAPKQVEGERKVDKAAARAAVDAKTVKQAS